MEEQLGTRWAVWVGGLALGLGGLLLVRYSIEQGVFGPGVRIGAGALLSLTLVVAGEWFRRTERRLPVEAIPAAHVPSILTAAGTVIAFGTTYAAHALYGFIGPAAAFVLLGAIGVATMLAAALHGPALAGLGLAGALIVPLLVSSGAPNPWPLVIHLGAVAAAAYALARLRRWLWLASAVVVGAFVWGAVLLAQVANPAGDWASALFVHVGVQLALAAAFMALEPHLATPDHEATPDWIATAALTALAVLAILALAGARYDAQWTLFAAAAMAILALTGWRSAPAAAAAALAGAVALGAIAAWPGLTAPPEPRLLAPAAAAVLRLPDNVATFLVFTAISTLAIAALATLRLWRGRALPVGTAGLYALAAVVTPLLALIVAYLRVTQFDRSIAFALFGLLLAALLHLVSYRFRRLPEALRTPVSHLATGAFAAGVAAAATLAFVMVLDRGYLTVAFALTALATAYLAVRDGIPLLRYVVVALGLIVLGRLAWDPRIMGASLGTVPIFNWLLLGYGVPAVAFLAAGRILSTEREDLAARLCDAVGVLLAGLLVFFQIRHALNGGDPLANTSGHIEQGLFALMSLGFAYVLMRLDLARANPVFHFASLTFGVLSAFFIVLRPRHRREPAAQQRRHSRHPHIQLADAGLPGARPRRRAARAGLAWRATRLVRHRRRGSRHGAAVRLRHLGGPARLPRRAHRDLEKHERARGVGLFGSLVGPRPRLSRLRHRARLTRGAARLGGAGGPVGRQGVPLRPHRHHRPVARVVGHLPGRRPDRHRHRLSKAGLCPTRSLGGSPPRPMALMVWSGLTLPEPWRPRTWSAAAALRGRRPARWRRQVSEARRALPIAIGVGLLLHGPIDSPGRTTSCRPC